MRHSTHFDLISTIYNPHIRKNEVHERIRSSLALRQAAIVTCTNVSYSLTARAKCEEREVRKRRGRLCDWKCLHCKNWKQDTHILMAFKLTTTRCCCCLMRFTKFKIYSMHCCSVIVLVGKMTNDFALQDLQKKKIKAQRNRWIIAHLLRLWGSTLSWEVNGRDEMAETKEKCGTALEIFEQFLFLK